LEGDENRIIEQTDVCNSINGSKRKRSPSQSLLICQENIDDDNLKEDGHHQDVDFEIASRNKSIGNPFSVASSEYVPNTSNGPSHEIGVSPPQPYERERSHKSSWPDVSGDGVRVKLKHVSSLTNSSRVDASLSQVHASEGKDNNRSTTVVGKQSKVSTPRRRTKSEREAERAKANSIATRAASLAAQTISSPEVAKQLLLSMALVRTNPRSQPTTLPPRGTLIPHGFFWGQYPPLESVLRDHMREYYDLSTNKCQSRDQQAFNNKLVTLVRDEARKHEWDFDGSVFDDKKIRDRIRCFFKTHIQNAKKRLKTMVKNPTKRANAKALAEHMDLIEKYNNKKKRRGSQSASRKRSYSKELEENGSHEYLSNPVSYDDETDSDNEHPHNSMKKEHRKKLKCEADGQITNHISNVDKESDYSIMNSIKNSRKEITSDNNESSLQVNEEEEEEDGDDDDDDIGSAAQQVVSSKVMMHLLFFVDIYNNSEIRSLTFKTQCFLSDGTRVLSS